MPVRSVQVGNLLKSNAQSLVNTVNCVGVMGKGIALAFKKKFPAMYEDYKERCESGLVVLGKPYVYDEKSGRKIINFPTKDHWRSVSRLSDIEQGLDYLEKHYKEWGITSLAVPPLGCGNGQLDWEIVGPALYRYLNKLDIPVEIYAPHGTEPDQLALGFLQSSHGTILKSSDFDSRRRVDAASVALAAIVSRIYREPYHWPIGRTTFQKIAFFATERGIPTGLSFKRSSYGPFSEDLKPLITKLVNNGLIVEEKLGRMFVVSLGSTYKDARNKHLDQLIEWREIIEKVADLFLRVNKTDQAEAAASAYFVAKALHQKKGCDTSEEDVYDAVLDWKEKRRPAMDEELLAKTVRELNLLGWVTLKPSSSISRKADDEVEASVGWAERA